MQVSGWWVPCVRNFFSFIPIFLKLYICLEHALKVFVTFLQFELSQFSAIFTMKGNGQWVPCARNSSYSFIRILLKHLICLDHALKMCT